ncbi:hypothetical protein WR25_13595 [Diploscapter pachys]|uniref:Autophagy-related protein 9 n=1 Tax=Diploscapter pachys TaxID=2018661 RepID=A0A2A2KMJ5_9BILA|nr:hypothetical protein WR25_13595 [Diploscapter pachys]
MFNFGRNKKQYQVIDDDYDEPPGRLETLSSLLPLSMPSSTAGQSNGGRRFYESGTEHERLIPGSSHTPDYHQDPPQQHLASSAPDGLTNLENGTTIRNPGGGLMSSSSRSQDQRWDHIQNLDEFFTRIYEYHQGGGFRCIALKRALDLVQFIFIVFLSTFVTQCIDYDVLFANKNTTTTGEPIYGKRHFGDAIVANCTSHLNWFVVVTILIAVVFWVSRVFITAHVLMQMLEIQLFYNSALGIEDKELPNLTWHAVVKRICEVQPRLHLMIHTEQVSAVDLFNRILRFKNYFVAMVNQKILPPTMNLPCLGEISYLPNGLKSQIKRILFYSSSAAWSGPYLKEEYKNEDMLDDLARQMEKSVTMYGLFNLVLFPFIFLYQILVSFFTISEQIRRRSDALGMRRYSNYGRYQVRHFNELDHELNARLNRSHLFANAYMDQFYSPLLEIIAKQAVFVAAAVLGVLVVLSSWDEDVLQIEHVITVMTGCGVVILICRGLIPDENLVWQPEVLLSHVASELHYVPSEWKGQAHTEQVRHEFEQYFQLKWMFIVEELSSPILTPFILLFWLRPRCRQLIGFLHDHTESVRGLGDICSFAMMDVARHGDPTWNQVEKQKEEEKAREVTDNEAHGEADAPRMFTAMQEQRARDGKTELSVLHFATLNPEWNPPPASAQFIRKFKHRVKL